MKTDVHIRPVSGNTSSAASVFGASVAEQQHKCPKNQTPPAACEAVPVTHSLVHSSIHPSISHHISTPHQPAWCLANLQQVNNSSRQQRHTHPTPAPVPTSMSRKRCLSSSNDAGDVVVTASQQDSITAAHSRDVPDRQQKRCCGTSSYPAPGELSTEQVAEYLHSLSSHLDHSTVEHASRVLSAAGWQVRAPTAAGWVRRMCCHAHMQ